MNHTAHSLLKQAAQHMHSAHTMAHSACAALADGNNAECAALRGLCAQLLAQAAALTWSADHMTGCAHKGSCARCWRHEEISALHCECVDEAQFCMQSAAVPSTIAKLQDLTSAVRGLAQDFSRDLDSGFLL